MHEDITARKTIAQILESFESLRGMLLLFNKETEYYKFSGMVTAALLDFEDGENGEQITILGVKTSDNWFTLKGNREWIKALLQNCDAFVGQTAEESFLLQN